MNTELLLNTNIQNIATVYGGVRGTTLSSRHNMRYWQTIVDSGVRTTIELRNEDHSDRLCKMCEMYGIRYFAFPMDSYSVPNETIAYKLQEFCELIDDGKFYIACAMGLHRTDMALSVYWMFHGADIGLNPPILKGHIENGKLVLDRLNNKVFRRLNSLYDYLAENNIVQVFDRDTFAQRKRDLIDFNRLQLSIV
ncbi:MAG: hypothetical protein J6R79_02665 [Bacteroidaceae bacterium]|nr:hypothetical protein [Bacteroidaceae bacterium]